MTVLPEEDTGTRYLHAMLVMKPDGTLKRYPFECNFRGCSSHFSTFRSIEPPVVGNSEYTGKQMECVCALWQFNTGTRRDVQPQNLDNGTSYVNIVLVYDPQNDADLRLTFACQQYQEVPEPNQDYSPEGQKFFLIHHSSHFD